MNDGNDAAVADDPASSAEANPVEAAVAIQGVVESQAQNLTPGMLISVGGGRIENKLVSADRTAVNEVLAKENADDWHVISAHNTGNHFDLILERTLYDEPAAVEPAPVAEENPAASSEASPV